MVYQCINSTIHISCPMNFIKNNVTEHVENITIPQTEDQCVNKTIVCDLQDNEGYGNVFCKTGALFSKNFIFCNSTTLLNGTSLNESTTILNCYEGQLPENQASFIPTTTQTPITTTEKSLSFAAKVHVFFLKLIGKGDVLEKSTTPLPIREDGWIPEALTIPPETLNLTSSTDVNEGKGIPTMQNIV